ncbi:MAG: O-antigen ligase family protein, partial [candidate division WOR-3 bacterium]
VERLLGGRFASFKILEYDVSLLARMELGKYVIEKVRQSPFLGVGLADFVRYRYFPTLGRFNVYLLDNTYLQLLWKTGILGLTLFLGMMGFFLARAWFILKKGRTTFDKIIGSSIFFSFLTLMISGLQCAILVGYRFNLVWAVLAGITELRAREIKNQIERKD